MLKCVSETYKALGLIGTKNFKYHLFHVIYVIMIYKENITIKFQKSFKMF